MSQTTIAGFEIRPATEADVPIILSFITKLAVYEKLAHEVVATEESIRKTLFGGPRTAEVAIGYLAGSLSASFCSFTIIPHSSENPGSTLRIFS